MLYTINILLMRLYLN